MTGSNVQFDQSLLGLKRRLDRFPMKIMRDDVLQYAAIIGETYPLYIDEEAAKAAGLRGIVAPPTFSAVLTMGMGRPDIGLEGVGSSVLATEAVHRLAFICAGDTLDATIHLKSVYAKTGRSGSMVFVVWVIDFTNQEDELVETVEKSYVYKGGK